MVRVLHNGLLCLVLACAAGASSTASAAVRYVAPQHPGAQDAGAGSPARPYRTITYAMSQLMPGDTLLITGGQYREALRFTRRSWSVEKPTTIIGLGDVTLLGTEVVNDWEPVGDGLYAKRNWDVEPQQVVLEGSLLQQIGGTIFGGFPDQPGHPLAGLHRDEGGIWPGRVAGSRNTMPMNSFLYDRNRRELVIRSHKPPPRDATEVSVRPFLIFGESVDGVAIRNIRIRYANTSTESRMGAVTLHGNGNALERLTVEDVDGAGIQIQGNDNTLLNTVVVRAGYLGVKARGARNRLIGNRVSQCNVRGMNKWWEAGGMKFIGDGGLRDSVVANNVVIQNRGDGIWFDWGNDANLVEANVVAYNGGFGIHYEASSRAMIVANQSFGNKQRGIYLYQSRESVVAHNLIVANALDGLVAMGGERVDPKGKLDLRPQNNQFFGNLIGWNRGAAVILPGKDNENRSGPNVYVGTPDKTRFSMGWPSRVTPPMNLARWREQYGQDQTSAFIDADLPSEIAADLAKQSERPNWAALHDLPPEFAFNNREIHISAAKRVGDFHKVGQHR